MIKRYNRYIRISSLLLLIILSSLLSCSNKQSVILNFKDTAITPRVTYDVIDFVVNGNSLFIADRDSIIEYSLSDMDESIFYGNGGNISYITSDDAQIYAYDNVMNNIIILDTNGKIHSKISIDITTNVRGLCVTANYILLLHDEKDGYNAISIEKDSLNRKKHLLETRNNLRKIRAYKDDIILLQNSDGYTDDDYYFVEYDIEKSEYGNIFQYYEGINDFSYNGDNDEIFFSSYSYLNECIYINKINTETLQHEKILSINSATTKNTEMIRSSKNILAWYDKDDRKIHIKNLSSQDKSIVILNNSNFNNDIFSYFIQKYANANDKTISIINYNDETKIKLKLMANDTDFDLYISDSYHVSDYINSSNYLNVENICMDYLDPHITDAIQVDNKIFGVPIDISVMNLPGLYEELPIAASIYRYLVENVNVIDRTYDDTKNTRLYDLIDNMETGQGPKNYNIMFLKYLMINPFTLNGETVQDIALEFVKFIYGKSEIEGIYDRLNELQFQLYSDINFQDIDSVYYAHRHIRPEITQLFNNTYNGYKSGIYTKDEAVDKISDGIKAYLFE